MCYIRFFCFSFDGEGMSFHVCESLFMLVIPCMTTYPFFRKIELIQNFLLL